MCLMCGGNRIPPNTRVLNFGSCPNITCIHGIHGVKEINCNNCPNLMSISGISEVGSIMCQNCPKLITIKDITGSDTYEQTNGSKIDCSRSPGLKIISNIQNIKKESDT